MRLFKVEPLNGPRSVYIDLDHILAVSSLSFWSRDFMDPTRTLYMGSEVTCSFTVTFAFREEPMKFVKENWYRGYIPEQALPVMPRPELPRDVSKIPSMAAFAEMHQRLLLDWQQRKE